MFCLLNIFLFWDSLWLVCGYYESVKLKKENVSKINCVMFFYI